MLTKNFLLEIGVEEIPAGYISNAIQKLKETMMNQLTENKLSYTEINTYSTPRRLAIKINSLQSSQKDEHIEKVGPAKRVAFDENGQLTKAGLGFLQGAGAKEDQVFIKETSKGEYIAVNIEIKGQSSEELLPRIIKICFEKLNFPKSMKWGDTSFSFARPIRWIIALLDDKIIDFKLENIQTGQVSQGNRFIILEHPIIIDHADDYPLVLKMGAVVADREERKLMIKKQMKELFKESKFKILEDERLLDQVTDLVEFPTAVISSYESKYLFLPEKIITSTLTQNQKYFAVLDENNQLSNYFVFVSNGAPYSSETIRIGNEKVVRARLEDAEFYYHEDTKKSLDSYVSKLNEVVFQAKLGTILEKTERIKKLSLAISQSLGLDSLTTQKIIRSAHLSKADLVTLMLGEKEFTKLQGYIGMKYALLHKEDIEVATAIYEHYMPRGQNDGLPSSLVSSIVAIADKIDTVCGIIAVNLVPTGSNDPFALRRAANGVVQIIDERNLSIDLNKLIQISYDLLDGKLSEKNFNKNIVEEFFKQRVRWLMEQKGIEYDVIDSLSHLNWGNIKEIIQRAKDISEMKSQDDFNKLVSGFKRVSNIIEKTKEEFEINDNLFEMKEEALLYKEYKNLEGEISQCLVMLDYKRSLNALVPFSQYIDLFFDKVLVNCEDQSKKNNRYALLQLIRSLFLKIADISKIINEVQ